MPDQVHDKRTAPWCWQHRAAIGRIRAALARDNTITSGIAVYVTLSYRANNHRQCWDTVINIAAESGTSESTTRRRITDLEHMGLIEISARLGRRGDTSNIYSLLDPPETELNPQWRTIPTPARSLITAEAGRRPPVSAPRRNGQIALKGCHGDTPGPVMVTPPPSHHDTPGPVMVTAPLKELTRKKEQEEKNNEISTKIFNKLPQPVRSIRTPDGALMGAPAYWSAIIDELAPTLTPNTINALRSCYLIGDAAGIQAVAPAIAIARSLDAKTAPAIRDAVHRIIHTSTTFSFYFGGS